MAREGRGSFDALDGNAGAMMSRTRSVAERLRGSDLRSIGDSNAVSRDLVGDPVLVAEAVRLLRSDDAVIRARSADALGKASAVDAAILWPHKGMLLRLARAAEQQEVRWHLAQMLPRLRLTAGERTRVIVVLREYLNDSSRIVAACALQGLWELGLVRGRRQPWASALVGRCLVSGPPAVKARARRLLREEASRRTSGASSA